MKEEILRFARKRLRTLFFDEIAAALHASQ
jgi:hypothetical protein